MKSNPIQELSIQLAVAIVRMVDNINTPKSSYLTDQIARSGTSVGANIHEA
ncbi:MAG: four helix bundle protein, partial [Clostridia bacterium]|nr:four helix bundle protein [Clostridia bacterium]